MYSPLVRTDPDAWIEQLFSSNATRHGAVVRRSMTWVDHEVGRDRFIKEVRRREFHLLRTADQFIVICHRGPIEMFF